MADYAKDRVLYELSDKGIASITLNEPEKSNPIDTEICSSIINILSKTEGDKQVKVMVLKGVGPHFSAGGDLKTIKQFLNSPPYEVQKILAESLAVILKLYSFKKPTIAQLHGTAMGGGCALALACDFVVAADNANLGFVFVDLGIVPDLGTMYLLPKLVGLRKAKELCYLGKIIPASAAFEMGMINRTVPESELVESVHKLALQLAGKPLNAIVSMKEIMQQGLDADLDLVLKMESGAQALLWTTEEANQCLEMMMNRIKNKSGNDF